MLYCTHYNELLVLEEEMEGNFNEDKLNEILSQIFGRFHRDNHIRKKGSVGGFLKGLFITYLIMAIVLFIEGKLVFDFTLSAAFIVIPFAIVAIAYGILNSMKTLRSLGVILLLLFIAANIVFSPIVSYKKHRNLIGTVEEVEFSEEIEPIDLSQLPTIDKELANKLADKKLGEIPSLGSQVTIGELHLQSINNELYYVAPLEHSSFIKWITNRGGTSGYIKVSATNQNDVQLVTELNGEPLKIKYLDSSYILSYLRRAAYFRDMGAGHTDFTFEIDDEGRPYWVITRYDTAVGLSERKAIGTLIMDAQTGESNVYSLEDTPTWVDIIQPATFIKNYVDKWGELVHGVFNFNDKDKLKSTDGMNLIYNNGECYYYTGITSVGNDEGLVGFTLTNTRSGKTTIYKTAGAIESASMKSAEGQVQQYGYSATFPYLINIQGEPTYFTTLKDSSGLVKQYALVDVKNYNTVGVGDTVQAALNKYVDVLSNNNISLDGSSAKETIEGEIERIGLVVKDGTSIYDIKLKDQENIFSISTETIREAALLREGDRVSVTYINSKANKYIIASDIKAIN